MNTWAFFLTTLAVFSGFFSLGAVVFLRIQKPTPVLSQMSWFLASLVLILLGFWFVSGPAGVFPLQNSLQPFFQLTGVVLNISIVPGFTLTLLSLEKPRWFPLAQATWGGLAALSGLGYFLFPSWSFLPLVVTGQLLLTIAGSLVLLGFRLKTLTPRPLRNSLQSFLVGSGAFLLLLVLDLAITLLPLPVLSPVDNLSLPLYLLGLNIGSFLFARKILSAPPLLRGGKITPDCQKDYGLSAREVDVLEKLLEGVNNQDLADSLFISRKTVENHLYNIFQKMNVKSRVQLIQKLRNWGVEDAAP